MRITLKDVEEKIKPLGNRLSYDKEFIFELLAVYGRAQGNITRLRNGQLNVANDKADEVAQKGIVYFKPVTASDDELYAAIDDLKTDPTVVRYTTRFVIVTNYNKLLAIDTRTSESLDISIREIDQHYTFFLPWAGMEKAQFIAENHADVKAAEKMAKLFDILVAYNHYKTADEWHTLTIFFTRLLFCFFAEDTNIFGKNQFSNAVASYTQEDGSDLKDFLHKLFDSLDASDKSTYPAHLAAFPYVNGQLFSDFTDIPGFNKQARDLLLESASKLDWSQINPDIFGSMFQAVVRPGERTSLGQHYTSVPNIMKTIEPLFLDELKEEVNNSYDDARKLEKLLARIGDIKIFDPACGSGNFLIIAYKELRRLEHAILERQGELTGQSQQTFLGSRINIENFYGIEIDDFPHEVAILSLWLAKHQMNLEFTEKFGIDLPLIPLKESGNIVHGNAAHLDWNQVCEVGKSDEVYLVGNPPYYGSRNQTNAHKIDLKLTLGGLDRYKLLDYIAIWFYKGANFIDYHPNAQLAFVTTNSINQGEQVSILWPHILDHLEIGFAHLSFRWENNAKGSAGVYCSIVSLRPRSDKHKLIIDEGFERYVSHINGYLADSVDTYIKERAQPLSFDKKMERGSEAGDNKGSLCLTEGERQSLLSKHPIIEPYIRPLMNAQSYLSGANRYALWLVGATKNIMELPEVHERILNVSAVRKKSPHLFARISKPTYDYLFIPQLSSERRKHLPVGFLQKDTIPLGPHFYIDNAGIFEFGVLSSTIHLTWMKAVSGKFKKDYRYSSTLVYNTFPIPAMTTLERSMIEEKSFAVLDARESHPEKTLAEMYDPDKMPDDLKAAHQELDEAVEAVYRKKPFESDEERLAHLFDLYETMTAGERKKS